MKHFNSQTAEKYKNAIMASPLRVELSPELQHIAESQARASHEGWMKGKAAQGYVYGPVTNDDPTKGPLTNPLMVAYDDLDDATKASNIANAVAIIAILRDTDCSFVNFTKVILYPVAKQIHDEWCREKFKTGWTWGPVTDKANKVHRDLVPFEVLATDPELSGDIAYDVDTARQLIIDIIKNCNVFPLFRSMAKLGLDFAANPV